MIPLNRRLLKAFLGICFIFYVMSVFYSIGKPASLDEADLANRAHNVTKLGTAAFARGGEQLTHPPMYQYTTAFIFKVFGEHEIPIRGFGVLCYLLTGFLLIKVLSHLLKDAEPGMRRTGMGVMAALYLMNPVIVQHSMFMDADTTWMTLFVTLFVYTFLRCESKQGQDFVRSRFILMTIFSLAFLSKEITPFLVAFGTLFYRVLSFKGRRFWLDAGITFVLGTAVAWGIWWLYCILTNTDVMSFLNYTLLRKTPRIFEPSYLSSVVSEIDRVTRWPIYWVSAPFYVLLLGAISWRLFRFFREKKVEAYDYLGIMTIAIWLPYVFIRPSIDSLKYMQPGFCLMVASVAFYCAHVFGRGQTAFHDLWEKRVWVLPLVFAGMVVGTIYYYRLDDYLLLLWDHPSSWRWTPFLKSYHLPLVGVYAFFIAIFFIFKRAWYQGLFLAALLCIFPINAAMAIHQTKPYTTAECWLNYGEEGLGEVAHYLSTRVKPEMKIASRHDILYHLKTRYGVEPQSAIATKYFFALRDRRDFARWMADPNFAFVIMDRISLVGIPKEHGEMVVRLLQTEFVLEDQVGRFAVFRRRGI